VFRFDFLPAKVVRVTDFTVGHDVVDLRGVLIGYSGSDPVADGYVKLQSDGLGGTNVFVDPDGAGGFALVHVATLKGVDPHALTEQQDWVFR